MSGKPLHIDLDAVGFTQKRYISFPGQIVRFQNLGDKAHKINIFKDKVPFEKVFGVDSIILSKDQHGPNSKKKPVKNDAPLGIFLLGIDQGSLVGEITAQLEVISPPKEDEKEESACS